jgi:hypothetical protein
MSDKVADLMLRNIQEVFNERDAARRIVAVKSMYEKKPSSLVYVHNPPANSISRIARILSEEFLI